MRLFVYVAEVIFYMAVIYFAITRLVVPIIQGRRPGSGKQLPKLDRELEQVEETIAEQEVRQHIEERRRWIKPLNTEPSNTPGTNPGPNSKPEEEKGE